MPGFSNLPFYKDLSTLVYNGRWAIAMTWQVSRLFLFGMVGCSAVQSVIPLGLVLSARGIVNAVVSGMNQGGENYGTLYFWLAAGL